MYAHGVIASSFNGYESKFVSLLFFEYWNFRSLDLELLVYLRIR
jgi:hypothetical protein